MLIVVGIPLFIAAIVFYRIIMYRLWWLLQGHGARTTPGKAVGFCFIPLFNFYWFFVAYAGLAKDNNAYMDKVGIQWSKLSYVLALAVCILGIIGYIICWIPYVGFIGTIPGVIIDFLFVRQMKNAILAILDHREEQAKKSKGK